MIDLLKYVSQFFWKGIKFMGQLSDAVAANAAVTQRLSDAVTSVIQTNTETRALLADTQALVASKQTEIDQLTANQADPADIAALEANTANISHIIDTLAPPVQPAVP